METFADYILAEHDSIKKMEMVHYLKNKTNIFFDNSVLLKTELAKMFIEQKELNVDENLLITSTLLCACKKSDKPQDLSKVKSYAKESAEFLKTLGFSDRFCKICEEQNRYSGSSPREKESDILELVDNFGGMLMHRPERKAFTVDEATNLLENRNLKDKDNKYLDEFLDFIDELEEIKVSEKNVIDDSISYISHLSKMANEARDTNTYIEGIIESRDLLEKATTQKEVAENKKDSNIIPEELLQDIKTNMENSNKVSSVVIDDEGYTLQMNETKEEKESLNDKRKKKITRITNLEKLIELDKQYQELVAGKDEIA